MKTYRIKNLEFEKLVDGVYNCYTPIGMLVIKRFTTHYGERFLLLVSASCEEDWDIEIGYFNSFENACDRATDYFIDELSEFVEEI